MSYNLLTILSSKMLTFDVFNLHLSSNYMTMKNSRKLKIHTKHQVGIYTSKKIPVIKLEGKWLNKLGFNEGQMINVEQEQNKLTITIERE